MRCALVLFSFAMLAIACDAAAPLPQAKPPRVVAPLLPAQPPARVTGCRAQPSTVYGTEPVVFVLDAPSPPAKVDVRLVDQRDQSVSQGTAQAPGEWRLTDVPSGDFTLQVGQKSASCTVTVNRELSRASEAPR